MLDRIHNGLAGYLARQNLKRHAERADGATVILVDKRYRVFCRPGPYGDLVLESHIAELPESPADADSMVRECLFASWVRMKDFPEVPALSEDGNAIVIQLRLPSDATADEFESALELYVNSLADWRRIFRVV